MPSFHRYRVAPEPPPPPQLSLREEIAIYKSKLRAVKAARIAAQQALPKPTVNKPKARAKKRTVHCWKPIQTYFKSLGNITLDFRRRAYMCMGYICCMKSEIRSFVEDEFPTQVPVV